MNMLRASVFSFTDFGRTAYCLFVRRASRFSGSNEFDVVVVGGGIVGCATARQLKMSRPRLRVALIEKELELAMHQTGHNSGVLHAGIYYPVGSLKAKLCVEGIDLVYKYCDEKKISYKKCGKLIVAVEEQEIPALEKLYERAKQNGCKKIEMVDSARITEIEPHCRGIKAIWSLHTGIVDWAQVTRSYADDFIKAGGKVFCSRPLKNLKLCEEGKCAIKLESDKEENALFANYVITCTGLQSDRVAQLTGCSALPKIVPFRGEYLRLKPEKHGFVKTNIYPVPNASLPFLGVHFTPTMSGDVLLGPNAVLAFKREGYKFSDISLYDLYDAISYSGMRKLIFKHFMFGVYEMYRGIFISAQVKQLQRYVPELKLEDVTRGPSGVRAQALDENGHLVEDFFFDGGVGQFAERLLHVRNAPSPGATSSLAIANLVTDKAVEKFRL